MACVIGLISATVRTVTLQKRTGSASRVNKIVASGCDADRIQQNHIRILVIVHSEGLRNEPPRHKDTKKNETCLAQ